MWVLRFARLIANVLIGLFCVVCLWPLLGEKNRHRNERWWSRCILRVLRVRVTVQGHWPRSPVMIASNHISWVDILAINSVSPSVFVAKSEIASWPVAGTLAKGAGTIFVERGRRHAVRAVIHAARDTLKAGRTVVVFPEGTTGDGTALLPFHSNMFQAAIDAGKPLVPMSLRYRTPDGLVSTEPAFVGEQTMLENLLVLLKHPTGFTVTLTPLSPLPTVSDTPETPITRQSLGAASFAAISAVFDR